MNILVPDSWLREHLETSASPEEIQRMLSLCGPSVERIHEVEDEPVYDIEVTTNRVDTFSVRGIAREAAVILPQFGVEARLKPLSSPEVVGKGGSASLPQVKSDPSLNRRTLMILLKDVKHTPTPEWMAKRLQQIEISVHDSIIDITNYITHELGHPCHAFDAEKIHKLGGEIIVKIAGAGVPFTTLDGQSYKTVGGEVIFTNPSGEIIDVPGIKGTANSAIGDDTQNVLFFIESIQPEKIRFTSMTHAIRTQAAQINEKNIDPNLASEVFSRGVELYLELTDAQIGSAVYDEFPGKPEIAEISLPSSEAQRYLGVDLPAEQVKAILKNLGCEVSGADDVLKVTPPSYRPDLRIPADLIEEIARIYGYHNLPSVLMDTPIPTIYPEGLNLSLEDQALQLLADLGYQELYTYSMVSEDLARQADPNLAKTLKLRNPLSTDMVYLRRSLLPSHLDVMARQLPQTALRGTFELADVYWPQEKGGLPDEHRVLAIFDKDLRSVRSALDMLFTRFHIKSDEVEFKNYEENTNISGEIGQFYDSFAFISHNGRVLGTIGYLGEDFVGAEIQWRELLASAKRYPQYHPIPTTAPYLEDITLEIPERTAIGDIIRTIKLSSSAVNSVTLLDRYQDRWTFRIKFWDFQQQVDAESAKKLREKALADLAKLDVALAQ